MSSWENAQYGGGLWALVDEIPMVKDRAADIERLLNLTDLTGVYRYNCTMHSATSAYSVKKSMPQAAEYT